MFEFLKQLTSRQSQSLLEHKLAKCMLFTQDKRATLTTINMSDMLLSWAENIHLIFHVKQVVVEGMCGLAEQS